MALARSIKTIDNTTIAFTYFAYNISLTDNAFAFVSPMDKDVEERRAFGLDSIGEESTGGPVH